MPGSEADTCRKFVVPKLLSAGWDTDPHSIAEQRAITDGRIIPVGKGFIRKAPKRVDYLLNRRALMTTRVPAGRLSEIDLAYDLKGNLATQQETYFTQSLASRAVTNTYDAIDRLHIESATQGGNTVATTYEYDAANNRASRTITGGSNSGITTYNYNAADQLTAYTAPSRAAVSLTYDANGNRTSNGTSSYAYDIENRLVSVTSGTASYSYAYDYRTRRVQREEGSINTAVVFSGGSSVAEYDNGATSPTVEYIRGSDWGGGTGGILYTIRGNALGVTHYDGRGDVVAKTDASGVLAYQASYEAFGKRAQEFGSTLDRQKGNTKEEDPTGLLDEGFRYRDLETGCFITRDPAGFVDGPNLYTYVRQNPWTKFDPEGLSAYSDMLDYAGEQGNKGGDA